MKPDAIGTVNYGNWVSIKTIAIPGAVGLACFGLGFASWPIFLSAAAFLSVCGYFTAARFLLSPRGGNLQDRVHELVMANIDWTGKGKALDIGCGNGPLAIKLALRYPQAEVVGTDSWGKERDYSMRLCAQNAGAAGVEQRVSFLQGSASTLPFKDASFDLVVSNLVFHEVKDVADKRRCIQEALRVLKPGGVFVLQDLFLLQAYYGTPQDLVKTVKGWGVREAAFLRTCDEPFIPWIVKTPFLLGTLAILRGTK